MIIFFLLYINYAIFNIIIIQDPKYVLKSAIIVNMNSYLDSQNFIGYESLYESYKIFNEFEFGSSRIRFEFDPLIAIITPQQLAPEKNSSLSGIKRRLFNLIPTSNYCCDKLTISSNCTVRKLKQNERN
jgi:hypothetical protein